MINPEYKTQSAVAIVATSVSPSVKSMRAGSAVPNIKLNTNNESALLTSFFLLARLAFGAPMTSR